MKMKVYKFACLIGCGLIIFAFLMNLLFQIKLLLCGKSLFFYGDIILGLTFLWHYYTLGLPHRKFVYWWQNVAGMFFLLQSLITFLPNYKLFAYSLLIILTFLLLSVKYSKVKEEYRVKGTSSGERDHT